MRKLNSGKTGICSPLSAEAGQELSLLYRQIQLKEEECSELRRKYSLLKRENLAISRQLETIRHIVFDASKEN